MLSYYFICDARHCAHAVRRSLPCTLLADSGPRSPLDVLIAAYFAAIAEAISRIMPTVAHGIHHHLHAAAAAIDGPSARSARRASDFADADDEQAGLSWVGA